MGNKIERIKDLYSYKTPKDGDNRKFTTVNKLATDFAIGLSGVVTNPAELTVLLRKIQEIRMLANQSICYESHGISYKQVFESEDKYS